MFTPPWYTYIQCQPWGEELKGGDVAHFRADQEERRALLLPWCGEPGSSWAPKTACYLSESFGGWDDLCTGKLTERDYLLGKKPKADRQGSSQQIPQTTLILKFAVFLFVLDWHSGSGRAQACLSQRAKVPWHLICQQWYLGTCSKGNHALMGHQEALPREPGYRDFVVCSYYNDKL